MDANLKIIKQMGSVYLAYEIKDKDSILIERGIDAKFEDHCCINQVHLNFEWVEKIYNEMKELQEDVK